MILSFKSESERGFLTNVEGKEPLRLKNSLSKNTENFTPTELLVLSIGSCTSDDVLSILSKMKQTVNDYQCTLNAEREEEIPKTLKSVNIGYELTGDVSEDAARKAVSLSLSKYCSVSILVRRGGAKVTYSLKINGKIIEDHAQLRKE
ncbi:MAG: OsmC family protein [Thermoplasmataceae archaeon]